MHFLVIYFTKNDGFEGFFDKRLYVMCSGQILRSRGRVSPPPFCARRVPCIDLAASRYEARCWGDVAFDKYA